MFVRLNTNDIKVPTYRGTDCPPISNVTIYSSRLSIPTGHWQAPLLVHRIPARHLIPGRPPGPIPSLSVASPLDSGQTYHALPVGHKTDGTHMRWRLSQCTYWKFRFALGWQPLDRKIHKRLSVITCCSSHQLALKEAIHSGSFLLRSRVYCLLHGFVGSPLAWTSPPVHIKHGEPTND